MAKTRKRRRNLGGIRYERDGAKLTCFITPGGDISDVKNCVQNCGSKFFSPSNMRFFKSRVANRIYPYGNGNATFVTSEEGPHGGRRYTARRFEAKTCSIDEVGEFQQHTTSAAAHRAAKKAAGR